MFFISIFKLLSVSLDFLSSFSLRVLIYLNGPSPVSLQRGGLA
jgi:hypothetical protein